jgi:nucleoside-diphosphate-sugar epimerase
MSIFLTGSSGFVGKNILSKFSDQFELTKYTRGTNFNIKEEIVIHCAGKAHDLKNTSDANEYYSVNTDLTKNLYDAFLSSDAKIFIALSSVKAVADKLETELTEDYIPNPITHYGKSKLLAEKYILNKEIPKGKRVFILRPCMIHGHGNKGNLNLLYKIVSKGFPWPLGTFENKRSFCSIDNLCFIIKELIENQKIPSGIYNIADNNPLSTNELITLIAGSQSKKPLIWKTPKNIIYTLAKLGDVFKLSLNSENLQKLTENYIVSNHKILKAINKSLPFSAEDGLLKTINSFQKNA